MILVDYEVEEAIYFRNIQLEADKLLDLDSDPKDFNSRVSMQKVNENKRCIRGLRRFKELGVELYRKRGSTYSFFLSDSEFKYSLKTRKLTRPGRRRGDVVQQRTLEKILRREAV